MAYSRWGGSRFYSYWADNHEETVLMTHFKGFPQKSIGFTYDDCVEDPYILSKYADKISERFTDGDLREAYEIVLNFIIEVDFNRTGYE